MIPDPTAAETAQTAQNRLPFPSTRPENCLRANCASPCRYGLDVHPSSCEQHVEQPCQPRRRRNGSPQQHILRDYYSTEPYFTNPLYSSDLQQTGLRKRILNMRDKYNYCLERYRGPIFKPPRSRRLPCLTLPPVRRRRELRRFNGCSALHFLAQ